MSYQESSGIVSSINSNVVHVEVCRRRRRPSGGGAGSPDEALVAAMVVLRDPPPLKDCVRDETRVGRHRALVAAV